MTDTPSNDLSPDNPVQNNPASLKTDTPTKGLPSGLALWLVMGMMLGSAVGTSLGAALDNVGMGVAMGPALGMSLGIALYFAFNPPNATEADSGDDTETRVSRDSADQT